MATDSGNPVEVYRARNLPEAHAVRVALEQAGVLARIDNEMLQGAVGELPAGWATAPRILVAPADAEAARAVLKTFLNAPARQEPGDDSCLACGAAMGASATCPACGWSFRGDGDSPDEEELPEAIIVADDAPRAGTSPAAPQDATARRPRPGASRRALWAEVAAVMAASAVPYLVAAISTAAGYSLAQPPWLDALQLTVQSGCAIVVTLYVIGRSGLPWARFGLGRPAPRDIPLGLLMFGAAAAIGVLECVVTALGSGMNIPGPPDHGAAAIALIVVKHAANGLAEELVTRAYLITRLEQLLRSRAGALAVSTAVFASYHLHYGAGVVYIVAFGFVYGLSFVAMRRVWPLALGHALYNVALDLRFG